MLKVFSDIFATDTAHISLLISLAAFCVSLLGAIYARRQAHQAYAQRVLSQYLPLSDVIAEVSEALNKVETVSTVAELEDYRAHFVALIKRSQFFLPPKLYKSVHSLLSPFHDALNEKRGFIENRIGGKLTPNGFMAPKNNFRVLETCIINFNFSLPRQIWRM